MAKKSTPKRKYTVEFKADVLRLVANGEPILSVARKMGIAGEPSAIASFIPGVLLKKRKKV